MQSIYYLTHLLALFLPFLVYLNASPAPDPYPAVVSLPARTNSYTQSRAQPQPTPDVEHDLLPFVIVSTIDGSLHAVDRETGDVRWTLSDDVDPLVGGGIRGKGVEEEYIVEPLSGDLYVFDEEEEIEGAPRVRKLPLSVEQLIEMSPFTFPHSPSRTFTGSKHTSLLTIDLRTGHQISCFSSLKNASVLDDDCLCEDADILDDLEGKSRTARDVLFVGRSDYRLTIHTPPSLTSNAVAPALGGEVGSRKLSGVQEISYSTYTPNTYDKALAEYWAKYGSTQTTWDGKGEAVKRARVELGYDGVAVGVEEGGKFRWSRNLGSVGIAVYDVLLPLTPVDSNPILVPQPPPHLLSLFPPSDKPRSTMIDVHSRPPTTYIGSVPFQLTLPPAPEGRNDEHPPTRRPVDSSAGRAQSKPLLYALSSSAYPLINFAPPPRPGSLANGSFLLSEDVPEQDQLLPYLLDPPAEDQASDDTEELHFIDAVPIKPKNTSRKWLKWTLAPLVGLLISGLGLAGFLRYRQAQKQSVTPVSEKTPLLIKDKADSPIKDKADSPVKTEKSVTIIEPNSPGSPVKPGSTTPEDEATPRKKGSNRRRVRGRKKKNGASKDGDAEDDDEEEDGTASPPHTIRKDDKPLPELPREISTTALSDMDDKERLAISDVIIGYGSHGTVVLKGTWGGRPVAVKRLLSDFTRLASQEVKLLQASDDHPNVIRYYCQERRDNFLYIALDLCQASLADIIESPDKHQELVPMLDVKKALINVTAGLKHLHGMKIIHRDIKPQNVLVSKGKDGQLRLLVSDFGLARRLEQDQSSFAPTANNLAGSLGWRAPECIRGQVRLNEVFDRSSNHSSESESSVDMEASDAEHKEAAREKGFARLTKAVDLFALGCLYFWVLTNGQHPYGAVYDRESNIVKGDVVKMDMLDVLAEEGYEARELIGRMLSMDPMARPDTAECLIHPFFWSASKRLAFLCDASDRFEIMEPEAFEDALVMLEDGAANVVGKDWYSRLDKTVTSNLGKYRKYKGNSVRDLLRAMRNKKHHYQDLEPHVKRQFGPLPHGFLHYFTSRYPKLFLHVHAVVKNSRLRTESMFEGYFRDE